MTENYHFALIWPAEILVLLGLCGPARYPKNKGRKSFFLVVIYIYECKLRSELLFPVEINSVTLLQNSEIYIWNIRKNALSNAENQHENFDEFLTFFLKRYRRDILYDS